MGSVDADPTTRQVRLSPRRRVEAEEHAGRVAAAGFEVERERAAAYSARSPCSPPWAPSSAAPGSPASGWDCSVLRASGPPSGERCGERAAREV